MFSLEQVKPQVSAGNVNYVNHIANYVSLEPMNDEPPHHHQAVKRNKLNWQECADIEMKALIATQDIAQVVQTATCTEP